MSYRGLRGADAPLHPRLLMVSPLRGFLHTTTCTAIGYIVVDEKLNFLPKRVYLQIVALGQLERNLLFIECGG